MWHCQNSLARSWNAQSCSSSVRSWVRVLPTLKSFYVRHRNLAANTNVPSTSFARTPITIALDCIFEACQPSSLFRSSAEEMSSSRSCRSSVRRGSAPVGRHRPTRRQTFQNTSPFALRCNRKLIKMSVRATFLEMRHHHLVCRRSSLSDQFPETPVTPPSCNVKAPPSSASASPSDSKEPQAASISEVFRGEDEVIPSDIPEPEALTLSGAVGSEVNHEGDPLQTGGQDFERRIRTCTYSSTTTTTATMTKTYAVAHRSTRTESPPVRVLLASNKGGSYPMAAAHVRFLRGRREAGLPESSVVEEERKNVNISEQRTHGATYHHLVLAISSPSS
ncbi:hypothetical protein MTO96_026728 [Rhipicephalus appendiculatus]